MPSRVAPSTGALIQLAMISDQPYEVLRDTIWTHPTMAESFHLLATQ
jgi:hypothetical protein